MNESALQVFHTSELHSTVEVQTKARRNQHKQRLGHKSTRNTHQAFLYKQNQTKMRQSFQKQ